MFVGVGEVNNETIVVREYKVMDCRCDKCEAEEVVRERWDCQSCKLTWFPEELVLNRFTAYVDKAKKEKLYVEVPEGNMLVFDVGRSPTSEYVSRGET